MASKKKNYHYVLVFTNGGPVYVTDIESGSHWAHWKKEDKPMEFSATYAEDLVLGLNLNGHHAVLIKSKFEIDRQPYRYEAYECKFEKKEKDS